MTFDNETLKHTRGNTYVSIALVLHHSTNTHFQSDVFFQCLQHLIDYFDAFSGVCSAFFNANNAKVVRLLRV